MQPTSNYWADPLAAQQAAMSSSSAPSGGNGNPNLLERLLPTAGAIAGGLGAGALDLVTGGAAIPFDAAIAGAGSTLGKVGENALTHQKLSNGTLGAFGGGAIGQGTGEVAGNLLGKGIGVLGNLSSKTAGKFVQGQIAPGLMTGTAAKDLLNNYGVTSIAKSVPKIADTITGSSDAPEGRALVNKAVEDALQNSPLSHTDISDIGGNFTKNGTPINSAGKSFTQQAIDRTSGLSANDQKVILNNVDTELHKLPTTIGGATDNMSAFNLSRAFANRAGNIADQASRASGSAKTSLQATGSVYDDLAKELADRTLSPGGQDITLAPGSVQALKDGITQQLGAAEPKAAGQITADIDNAARADGSVSARDLRAIQAKWVVANKGLSQSQQIADKYGGMTSADLAQSGLPIAGAIAGGGKGLVAGALGALTKSPTVDAGISRTLSQGGAALSKGGVLNNLIQPTAGAMGAGVGDVVAQTANGGPANQADALTLPTISQGNTMNPQTGQPNNLFQSMLPGSGVSQNYAPIALQALMGMFDPSLLNSTVEGNAATAQGTIQKANQAAALLPMLQAEFNQAGGAQGPVAGTLSRLSGLVSGSPAGVYNKQAAQEAQALQAAGVPVSQSNLPQLTQNKQSAQDVLQNIQSLLTTLGATQ